MSLTGTALSLQTTPAGGLRRRPLHVALASPEPCPGVYPHPGSTHPLGRNQVIRCVDEAFGRPEALLQLTDCLGRHASTKDADIDALNEVHQVLNKMTVSVPHPSHCLSRSRVCLALGPFSVSVACAVFFRTVP